MAGHFLELRHHPSPPRFRLLLTALAALIMCRSSGYLLRFLRALSARATGRCAWPGYPWSVSSLFAPRPCPVALSGFASRPVRGCTSSMRLRVGRDTERLMVRSTWNPSFLMGGPAQADRLHRYRRCQNSSIKRERDERKSDTPTTMLESLDSDVNPATSICAIARSW